MYLGLPLGASRIQDWLAPVFEEGEAILHHGVAEPAYQLFGIDGVLILATVTIATIGLVIAWRLFGSRSARSASRRSRSASAS